MDAGSATSSADTVSPPPDFVARSARRDADAGLRAVACTRLPLASSWRANCRVGGGVRGVGAVPAQPPPPTTNATAACRRMGYTSVQPADRAGVPRHPHRPPARPPARTCLEPNAAACADHNALPAHVVGGHGGRVCGRGRAKTVRASRHDAYCSAHTGPSAGPAAAHAPGPPQRRPPLPGLFYSPPPPDSPSPPPPAPLPPVPPSNQARASISCRNQGVNRVGSAPASARRAAGVAHRTPATSAGSRVRTGGESTRRLGFDGLFIYLFIYLSRTAGVRAPWAGWAGRAVGRPLPLRGKFCSRRRQRKGERGGKKALA